MSRILFVGNAKRPRNALMIAAMVDAGHIVITEPLSDKYNGHDLDAMITVDEARDCLDMWEMKNGVSVGSSEYCIPNLDALKTKALKECHYHPADRRREAQWKTERRGRK